jgi:hypothetical protein
VKNPYRSQNFLVFFICWKTFGQVGKFRDPKKALKGRPLVIFEKFGGDFAPFWENYFSKEYISMLYIRQGCGSI